MNSSFSVLERNTSCMFASNSILRRQHFLIRSLRGYKSQNFTAIMAERKYSVDEVVAGKILRKITPDLEPGRYKGQAGKDTHFLFFSCLQLLVCVKTRK